MRAAMALDDDAVEPEEDAAIDGAGITLRTKGVERASSEQRTQPRHEVLGQGLPDIGAHLPGGTFGGLQRNIALKTAEGTARQVGTYLRMALSADPMSRLGALLASRALNALRRKMDPRTVNGGVFLGLNGIVIKSHGGTDEIGVKSALGLAYEMARSRLMDKVAEGMRRFPRPLQATPVAALAPQPEAKPA